jgi:hypothetical protein
MELFLNLIWLVVAGLALGASCKRWAADGSEPQRQTRQGWIALACALVLLFFVISLTDDLHAEVMVSEEASASKRHSCSVASHSIHAASRKVTSHHFVAVLPPTRFFFLQVVFVGKVKLEALPAVDFAVCSAPVRAPPA